MPIVTGQVTAPALSPRARAAIGNVGTWMASAYQYHAPFERPSGSKIWLS